MLEKQIEILMQPFLDDEHAYLIAIEIKNEGGWKKVEIYVDTDSGIKLDECARISRRLGHLMEEENTISTKYRLEVSSPGLSRPLTHPKQLERVIGKKLDVTYKKDDYSYTTEVFELSEISETSYSFGETKIEKDKIKEIKIHLEW